MTTEELIIGHFEGSLDAAEAAQLREVLDASPDARTLFENHEALHSLLRADVAALVPATPLVSKTLETALATPGEVATQTVGRWGFGQIAAGFSALVLLVGGTLIATRPSETAAPVSNPTPAVAPAHIIPAPTVPNPPQLIEQTGPKTERTTASSRTVEEPRRTTSTRTVKTAPENQNRQLIGRPETRVDGDTQIRSPKTNKQN